MNALLAAALFWPSPVRAEPASEPGGGAAAAPPALSTAAADFSSIDRLYLHRHEAGNLEGSIGLLEERLGRDSSESAALWRLGRALVRRGEKQISPGEKLADFSKARDLIDKSLSLEEKDTEANFWWGIAAGRWGQERGMLRSLFLVGPIKKRMRRVLELDPGHGGAHHLLGELYRQLPGFAGGSKKKAVSEFEAAVRLSPRHTVNHTALGRALIEAGEKGKAGDALRNAFEVKDPDDPAEHGESLREARRMLEGLPPSIGRKDTTP